MSATKGGFKRANESRWLRALAKKILQQLGQSQAELGLVLVNDRQIRYLNKKYRGQDRPTDVLSFPLWLDPKSIKGSDQGPPPLLGDVVISLETARRQALEEGHRLDQEVGRLLIHGILHLLGYDHEEVRAARRMRRKERELAKELIGEGEGEGATHNFQLSTHN